MSKFQKGDRVRHAADIDLGIGLIVDIRTSEGRAYVNWPSVSGSCDEVLCDLRPENSTETRTTSSTGAEKGVKAEAFSLLPVEALEKVARHYRIGAEKYSAHNWRAGYEWSKSYDALQRHANAFWRGEDMDAETGSPHMAAVAFHALALLTFMDEQPGFDDRYKASSAP